MVVVNCRGKKWFNWKLTIIFKKIINKNVVHVASNNYIANKVENDAGMPAVTSRTLWTEIANPSFRWRRI